MTQSQVLQKQTVQSCQVWPSMLPPIMYRSLSFWGKHGSNLTARARLVSGPRATKETCGQHKLNLTSAEFKLMIPTTDTFHLLLVFRHQSNHCIHCMFTLEFRLPLWISVLNNVPESICSKVITDWVTGSNQRTFRTSEHWDLQKKDVLSTFIHRRSG